ncbi:APC family permease [Synoicihabitans lomoniglobus]|uniref:Amino acid permease n=1 Tax=Synoicihabitans lomoniglobus TaxID=2909285 RepID=A0AAF0CRS2_9BACT|nr:amino acid permease [Opitutaceae bacterium LMO-M01]WED66894.1 amino acid permease [Opitutaceae bacterium LMO-M01]
MARTTYKPAIASAVIIANMIGTGVFTSLGYQLLDIKSGFVLIMLWVVGGVTALCGALSYAELGAALPRSGGEYNFLSRIYHPMVGFVSGWISATIGFAAPVALAAITFGSYLSAAIPALSPTWLAVGLIVVVTVAHTGRRKRSSNFQSVFTAVKISLIVGFCVLCSLMVDEPQAISFLPKLGDGGLVLSGAFAVSLIYVNYAYTGWNSVTYLINEVDDAQRNLPRILITSTLTVMILYVALNWTFLYVAPIAALESKVEVGYIAAQHVFGEAGASAISAVLSLLLISTVSAMTIAGPRVLQVIGEDFALFGKLARKNEDGIPTLAILVQSGLALIFVLTSSFESILLFSGFILGLNTLFAVAGVFVLRWKQPDLPRPYRTWLYPLPPLIYLGLMLWTVFYIVKSQPIEAAMAAGLIVAGVIGYVCARRWETKPPRAD